MSSGFAGNSRGLALTLAAMRALTITRYGGPEVLKVRELATPTPKSGEVLIRVARAGLNFSDIAARQNLYPDAPKAPMVMGYEVSGTVEQAGPGTTRFKTGDRVSAMCRFNGQASHVVVPEGQLTVLPSQMTFDEAAALPVNYLTAFHILFHVGQLRPGDKVLVHMAAGGVGQSAIQLCRTVEGVEIFGTASAKKHDALRAAGVQHPIDYHSKDYAQEVMRMTGGKGVQWVLDPLGGADWNKGYNLLAPSGRLAAYGWANMISGTRRNVFHIAKEFLGLKRYSPMKLMSENRCVFGVNMGNMWGEAELIGRHLDTLMKLYTEGKIRPVVDSVFPLEKGADAHRYVQERRNVGKVLFNCE